MKTGLVLDYVGTDPNTMDESTELCRAWGKVKDQEALIFFDGGAKANFISPELAARLEITPDRMGPPAEAILAAPDRDVAITPVIGKLCLHCQGYLGHEDFYIMPLEGCDVLLGIPWNHKNSTVVDYRARQATLTTEKGISIVLDIKLKGESIPIVSASAISKLMKTNLFVYSIFLKEVSDEDRTNMSTLDTERQDFLHAHADCFSEGLPGELPPVRPEDHTIDLIPRSTPPNRPPYRVSRAQNEVIMNEVKDLLEKSLIQPSSSPFCSLVLLVLKKDGSWRMYIDYRALNKITIKNRFPIPRIDDILDRLQGSSCFNRIDLKSGYHQIRIAPGDVYKTAFRMTFGLFEFLITERINDISFRLRLPDTWKIHNAFHVNLLKPFRGDVPDDREPDEQPEVEENEEILVPEQILAHKDTKTKGKVRRKFLVKFKNYPALDAKWMEEEDLADTPQIVKLYLEAFGLA
ncbi:hypothetical protein L7F22_061686 [Adiantum nelumboides]|nr:hypothetical protein [Adiantum nelumboides]